MRRSARGIRWMAVLATVSVVTASAQEGEEAGSPSLIEAVTQGKPTLDMRLRYEYGDQDGLDQSDALTVRTRLGYGTEWFHGLMAFLEFEDVTALNDGDDYNQAGTNPGGAGKTVIADVEGTELNRAYLAAKCPSLGSTAKVGRQRMTLDNHRFIGNVGWRQNEQTYDAARIDWAREGLISLGYGYIDQVNRIFGNENGTRPAGAKANAYAFRSDSHYVHVASDALPVGTLTGYAYLLDLGEGNLGATNSSDTIGVRLQGAREIGENTTLQYEAEYAVQSDNSATPAGRDYEADYVLVKLACAAPVGTLGVGYELLGSDKGVGFSTPLATLHKFNGWADVFLATPSTGLEDLFVYAQAMLPCSLKGIVAYHDFSSDTGGIDYGTEVDLLLVKKISENISVLAKFASYSADNNPGNPRGRDVERGIIEATLRF